MTRVAGWPPRWLTPTPAAALRRSSGPETSDFIDTFCRVTKDSIGGRSGDLVSLRGWQRQLIRHVFAVRPDGRLRHRQALIGVARKNGKALDVATPILTGDGWRKMGDLRPGDAVHTTDGSLARVAAVSPVWTDTDCYAVRFADGAELVASAEHLWTVNDRLRATARTVTTRELAATLTWGTRGDRRYTVDVPKALERADADLPVDPYVLGLWLGDGATAAGRITSADPAVFSAIESAGYSFGASYSAGKAQTRQVYGLQVQLRELGVLGNKHIPDPYLTASMSQRMDLLRGLMDTDGAVTIGPNTPRVEFCNTSRQLADGVLSLARSLGWKASLKESRAKLYGRDCGPRYRVCWTAHRGRSPFGLARKTELLHDEPQRPTRARTNAVVDVEPVPTVDTVCIEVEHPSGVFLAGEALTPTHNSALGAGIALDHLLFASPGSEVYSCAGDREQARIVFGTAKRMVELDPELSERLKLYRDAIEHTEAGSVYKVLSAEAYSKEGLNPTLVLFDEVHVQPNRELWDVMAQAMGARIEPLMIGITTAGVRFDGSGQDSLCYSMYQYGKRVASGEVDDPSFFFAWWEPKNPDADRRDPKTWREASPGLGDIVSEEDYAAMVLKTPESEFRTKRCNQFVASSSSWLPVGAWDSCESDADIPDGTEVCLGFDGSFNNDSTALVVATCEEKPHVGVVECWERPAEAAQDWAVPIVDVEDAIRAACKRWTVREIVCDPYRWARTYQVLEDEGLPIVEYPQSPSRMTPATQRFYEAVMNKGLTQSGDQRLARHIGNAVLKQDSRGTRIMKEARNSARKIDLAVAAVMAFDRAATPAETVDVWGFLS